MSILSIMFINRRLSCLFDVCSLGSSVVHNLRRSNYCNYLPIHTKLSLHKRIIIVIFKFCRIDLNHIHC